jgi:hypothetical protein
MLLAILLRPFFSHFCVNCFISDFLSGPLHIGLVFHDNLSYLRGIKQIVHSRPPGIMCRGFRKLGGKLGEIGDVLRNYLPRKQLRLKFAVCDRSRPPDGCSITTF